MSSANGSADQDFCVHDPLLGCRCYQPNGQVRDDRRGALAALLLGALLIAAVLWIEAGSEPVTVIELDSSHIAGALFAPSGDNTFTENDDPIPADILVLNRAKSGQDRWTAPECQQWVAEIRQAGLPAWMVTVAWRESRCRSGAVNLDRSTGDESYGLFQINTLGTLIEESRRRCGIEHPEELLDPQVNISCAGKLYQAYGYKPWNRGVYFTG